MMVEFIFYSVILITVFYFGFCAESGFDVEPDYFFKVLVKIFFAVVFFTALFLYVIKFLMKETI